MATYYWVGGAGNWGAGNAANWALSSGGAGGAGIPTATDNVIFDNLSNATAYAVTVGNNAFAADVTLAGPAVGNVTITLGATAVINCYGSWTNAATGVAFSSTAGAAINFLATSTGKTVTTNGVSISNAQPTFNGVGGGWTLGSAFTTTSTLSVTNGAFSTGNFALNANIFNSSNSNVRSVSLGSSTVTLTGTASWVMTTTTNLTFNAGTSTIILSNAAPTFAGGGLTYYNVNFTNTTNNTTAITGNNTFNNLTQASPTTLRRVVSIGNSQVINGILTLGTTNTAIARIQVLNTNIGSPITLTVAVAAALSDVDFRDITIAGTASPLAGVRLGNGLGNTNITFVAGKTVYWNLVAGGNWSATAWALTSGGVAAVANFPLAQDTVVIENTGLTTGNTITVDSSWWLGTLNVTRTNAWTLTCTGSPTIYGDATLSSVTTISGAANFTFSGKGITQNFTTNGVVLSSGIIQQNSGGTLLLNGAVTCAATATVTLNNGTLDLASYTLTTGSFSSSNSNARTIAFGTGKIVLTGLNGTSWTTQTATNLTLTGTPRVEISGAGTAGQTRTIDHGFTGGTEANSPNFYVTAGVDNVAFLNQRKYGTIDFSNGGTSTFAGNFQSDNWVFTIYGNLVLTSAITGFTTSSVFQGPFAFGATSGVKTITSAGKTYPVGITFSGVGGTWQLQDNATVPAASTTTLTSGTLDLNNFVLSTGLFNSNNSNVRTLTSGTGAVVLTGNGGNLWQTNTATNLTYTTIPNVSATYSGATGTRAFNTNGFADRINLSITAGTDIVAPTTTFTVNNYNFTGFAGTLTNVSTNIYGSLTLSSGMTVSAGTSTFTFAATSGTNPITSNGKTLDFPVTFNGVGGTWQLQDAMIVGSTRTTTLTNGALVLNGFDLTTGQFSSSNTNARTLSFGTNKIVVTGNNAIVFTIGTSTNLTLLGTPQVEATYAGSTGTRTITPGATFTSPETNAVSVRVTAGGDTVILSTTSSAYKNVEFTSGFTGTVQMANAIVVYGNWSFSPNMVTPTTSTGGVTFASTNATPRTITSNGKAFGGSSIVFSGVGGSWQLQDNFAIGSTNSLTLTTGALDLNNFSATAGILNSSNSNTRAVAFGASGKFVINGVNTSVVTLTTATGLTYTGTSRIEVTGAGTVGQARTIAGPTTGGTEANASSIYVTNGSDTINIGTANRTYGTLDFTGFGGTLQTNTAPVIFGSLVLSTGMTIPSTTNTNVWTFASTSAITRTITTNGQTLDLPLTFDGVGGTWAMQDALTLGSTRALTLANGTLKLKSGTTNVVGSFVTPGTTQTYLQATTSGSQATISAASGTNTATFITIQDSNATGGAVWQASNAVNPVNAGNNSGWNFATAISGVSGTGSVGTVISGVTPALTGVQATGSVGTLYIGWRQVPTTQTPAWTPVVTS